MKYIELKASLKTGLSGAYLISGDDRYLCFDALKKIEDATGIMMKDMNSVVLSGGAVTARDVADAANMYPFGDALRLVVVKEFSGTKKDDVSEILSYLSSPLSSTVLVVFCPEKPEIFRGMPHIVPIDCSKIEPKMIAAYIKNEFAKNDISSSEEAVEKLIMFCSNDMARVTNETQKLVAFAADTKVVTPEIVEECVYQDKEYQVFELAQFLAKGDAKSALDLVDRFMVKSGAAFQILSPLYNNYRRVLFVSINKDKTASELASLLGVKEFAIKMMKSQTDVFSSKKLKQIVDMVADCDRKIKSGLIKENVAIKTVIFNILNLRGNNG